MITSLGKHFDVAKIVFFRSIDNILPRKNHSPPLFVIISEGIFSLNS